MSLTVVLLALKKRLSVVEVVLTVSDRDLVLSARERLKVKVTFFAHSLAQLAVLDNRA